MDKFNCFAPNITPLPWILAFEETFGETVEDWYFRSAIPYLIEVFSEDGKGEIHIDEENHPPTYYCSPEISDPSVDSPTVQGVPTGPEPMIECSEMASILEAKFGSILIFDDYGDLRSLDGDMDGNACTREDTGGAVICSLAQLEYRVLVRKLIHQLRIRRLILSLVNSKLGVCSLLLVAVLL